MTTERINFGNRLIAGTMGWTFNGTHYVKSSVWTDREGAIHESSTSIKEVGYNSSWSDQVPAWAEIRKELFDITYKSYLHGSKLFYHNLLSSYATAIHENNLEKGFEVLIEAIEWINKNRLHTTKR